MRHCCCINVAMTLHPTHWFCDNNITSSVLKQRFYGKNRRKKGQKVCSNGLTSSGALCVAESILWYRYQSERGNARKDLLKLWDGLEMFGVWNRWKKQKNIILLFTSQECAKINQNYRRYAKQKLLQYFYRYCLYSTHPRMWYCSGIRRLQPISWFLDFQVS